MDYHVVLSWSNIRNGQLILDDIPDHVNELIIRSSYGYKYPQLLKRLNDEKHVKGVYICNFKAYICFETRSVYCNGDVYDNTFVIKNVPFNIDRLYVKSVDLGQFNKTIKNIRYLEYDGYDGCHHLLTSSKDTLLHLLLYDPVKYEEIIPEEAIIFPRLQSLSIKECGTEYLFPLLLDALVLMSPNITYIDTDDHRIGCNILRNDTIMYGNRSLLYKRIKVKQHLLKLAVTFELSARALLGRDMARYVARHIYYGTEYESDADLACIDLGYQEGDQVFLNDDDPLFTEIVWDNDAASHFQTLRMKKDEQLEKEKALLAKNIARKDKLETLIWKRHATIAKRERELDDALKNEEKALDRLESNLKKVKN